MGFYEFDLKPLATVSKIMCIVTAGCELLYLELDGHREERLQATAANGLAKSVKIEREGSQK